MIPIRLLQKSMMFTLNMEIELLHMTALSKYFTKKMYSMICSTGIGRPIKSLNKTDVMY